MPRPRRVPAYTLHKPSGQARVILDGRHVYLGPHGSPESREKYARLIAERFRLGGGGDGGIPSSDDARPATAMGGTRYPDLSVNGLLLRFTEHAEAYYVKHGRPTGEVANLKDAMRPLRALYSHTLARDFGPKALKAVRQYMITDEQLCRNVVNGRVNRIRRIFKWAVGEELVPPAVYEGLRAVEGLRYGRSTARESEPVGPVNDAWVDATLPYLAPQVADMVRLQRLTSMRPGEVVIMRPCDVDRTGPVWVYEPADHKMRSLGRRRLVALGPRARAIVEPYLDRPPQAYLFSPVEVAEWRAEQRRRERPPRRTRLYPCEARRVEREKLARRRRQRRRAPGERYDSNTYYRAIAYGIGKANKAGLGVPPWHPNQLRHSRATEVRRQYGLEGAQVVLGHAKADVTQVYAERDLERAKEIARKTG